MVERQTSDDHDQFGGQEGFALLDVGKQMIRRQELLQALVDTKDLGSRILAIDKYLDLNNQIKPSELTAVSSQVDTNQFLSATTQINKKLPGGQVILTIDGASNPLRAEIGRYLDRLIDILQSTDQKPSEEIPAETELPSQTRRVLDLLQETVRQFFMQETANDSTSRLNAQLYYRQPKPEGGYLANLGKFIGKGGATSIEVSALAHNLLTLSGIESTLVFGHLDNLSDQESFQIITLGGKKYLYDAAHPIVAENVHVLTPDLIDKSTHLRPYLVEIADGQLAAFYQGKPVILTESDGKIRHYSK